MNYVKTLVVLLVLSVFLVGCNRLQPIYEVNGEPISSMGVEEKSVAGAIMRAAAQRGWDVEDLGTGRFRVTHDARGKHKAVAVIAWSASQYSINYEESENLMADGEMIHRNYNRWIRNLNQEIKKELRLSSPRLKRP